MSEKKIKASDTSVYTADIFCTLRKFFLFYNECLLFSFFFSCVSIYVFLCVISLFQSVLFPKKLIQFNLVKKKIDLL